MHSHRLALAWLLFALLVVPSASRAQSREPTRRFVTNQRGDLVLVGNMAQHCRRPGGSPASYCDAIRSATGVGGAGTNNDFNMGPVDADSDATTSMSSAADLALASGASVRWAGLYWSCAAPLTGGADERRTVRFRAPGGGYADVSATVFDSGVTVAGNSDYYQGFAEVTAAVRAAGSGTYWVADMQCRSGSDNLFGGWTLVVVYDDATQPLRNLVVFDAFRAYSTSSVDVDVSGFVAPSSGSVNARVGIVVWDGDRGDDDTLRLISGPRNTLLGTAPGAGVLNPNDDIGNSTITSLGGVVSTRQPAYGNTLGYDQDLFATVDALPNGATSATIRAETSGEGIGIGILTFATDIFAPELRVTKTASLDDVDGNGADEGDLVTYTITTTNEGRDASIGTVLRDTLPAGTTLVGAIVVGGTDRTAATDGDQAELTGSTVVARLGTGASGSVGGRIAPAASVVVRITVRITSMLGGESIANSATLSAQGETLVLGGVTDVFTFDSDGDGSTPGNQATVIVTGPRCGDARLTGAESCEDGNVVSGDGCSAACRVEVDVLGPSGVVVDDDTPTFTGRAHPGSLVTVSSGGVTLGTATADATGSWSFTPAAGLSEGAHTVSASATDDVGNTTMDTTTVTIDTATFVTITEPTAGHVTLDGTPTIRGTGEPGASLDVIVDGMVVGMITVASDGTWSLEVPTALTPGAHTVRAVTRDASGHTAMTMDVMFVVEAPPDAAVVEVDAGAIEPTDAGRLDAGRADGGGVDAARTSTDGGPAPDAERVTAVVRDGFAGGGCGCRVAPSESGRGWLALAALGVVWIARVGSRRRSRRA